MNDWMNTIVDWLVGLMETIGAPGAGVAVFLENLFPPIPSEAVLPLAGLAAARGKIGLIEAIVWCTIGSVAGAWVLYALGALIGRDRVRAIAEKLPLVDARDLDRTEAWFVKHGPKAVFFGRMVPIFRSLISVPAGVTRMSPIWFTVLTALGSAIWNTIFVLAGFYLGENWHIVDQYSDIFQKIVIVVVVVAIVGWVVLKVRARRRRTSADA